MGFGGLEKDLQEFEREEFGTNDFPEIIETIKRREWADAQDRMTGMDAEQADWEEGEDD
jgi:hypothetical protein